MIAPDGFPMIMEKMTGETNKGEALKGIRL